MSEQSFAASVEEFDDLHGYGMLDSGNGVHLMETMLCGPQ